MMGFRNTLLFYTFKDQQAILTLSIGNTDETFPVQGKIHLFDNATTEEGLKKWINNQHSDGLFPDVPTPIFTGKLPEGSCKVTSHKQTGTSENPGPISPATFKNYEVKLSVKEHAIDKKVKLSAFTDTAQVHVKAEAGEVEAEVPILQTWSGGHSNVKKAGNLIIRDAKAWKEQWAKINSNRMPQPPLPKVDFDKQMLIVLFMGEKTTGGHSISVASIRDTGKQIEVAVKRKSPPPGGMSIMVMTQPYCIVAIAKTDKPITFKEAKDAKTPGKAGKPGKAGEGSGN